MYFKDPNWEETFSNYILPLQKNAHEIKKLSFKKFGMNWGIWQYDLAKLFEGFVNLEEIDLSHNYIDTIIIDFKCFPKLKKVNLSHNALYYWGQEGTFRIEEQVNAANLEELDLSYGLCGYIKLKQSAPFVDSLRWLDLSGNYFGLFGKFTYDKPPVLMLPKLKNLKYLALRDNNYTYVPKLRYLEGIENLDLSGNDISANLGELLRLPKLKRLSLCSVGWTSIPSVIYKLDNPEMLNFQGNNITEFEKNKLIMHFPETKINF